MKNNLIILWERLNNIARGLIPYAIITVLLIFVFNLSPYRIGFNFTDSVPKGVYFYEKGNFANIGRDDYVLFRFLSEPPYDENCERIRLHTTTFVKNPLGMPGDTISSDGLKFYREEGEERVFLGEANPKMPLIQKYESEVIPDSFYYVGSLNPKGFDSKYYGLVHRSQMIGKGWLIWRF